MDMTVRIRRDYCVWSFLIASALSGVVGCSPTGSGGTASHGELHRWTSSAPLLRARAAHAVVATSQAIFVAGGTDEQGLPVREVERFDGSTWSIVAMLPGDGLNAPAAAAIGDRILLVGGFETTTNVPTDQVLAFDASRPEEGWRRETALPSPRGGHAVAVLDGTLHVVGGGNERTTLATHSVYDSRTGQWHDTTPLPRSIGSPAAVVADGELYVIGGRSGSSDFGRVYRWEPATATWSEGPAITPRGTSGAVAGDGGIYVLGGESQASACVLADVLHWDMKSDRWCTESPMPTARSFARAVRFRDAIYVIGGSREVQRSHAPTGCRTVERMMADE
jgi:N-acetylneuraminic acid mutarotase